MNCPYCEEKLNDGDLKCPNCNSLIIDFDYMENLKKIEKKYGKRDLQELSKEKLTFSEIVTIRTFIERCDHHFGDDYMEDKCVSDGTSSNLRKRIEEIKKESNSI